MQSANSNTTALIGGSPHRKKLYGVFMPLTCVFQLYLLLMAIITTNVGIGIVLSITAAYNSMLISITLYSLFSQTGISFFNDVSQALNKEECYHKFTENYLCYLAIAEVPLVFAFVDGENLIYLLVGSVIAFGLTAMGNAFFFYENAGKSPKTEESGKTFSKKEMPVFAVFGLVKIAAAIFLLTRSFEENRVFVTVGGSIYIVAVLLSTVGKFFRKFVYKAMIVEDISLSFLFLMLIIFLGKSLGSNLPFNPVTCVVLLNIILRFELSEPNKTEYIRLVKYIFTGSSTRDMGKTVGTKEEDSKALGAETDGKKEVGTGTEETKEKGSEAGSEPEVNDYYF